MLPLSKLGRFKKRSLSNDGVISDMSDYVEAEVKDERNQEAQKNQIQVRSTICNCRTTFDIKTTYFEWNITKFWDICDAIDTLESGSIEGQVFRIIMVNDRKNHKLNFLVSKVLARGTNMSLIDNNVNINRYSARILCPIDGSVMYTGWKKYHSVSLFDVCLDTLRQNAQKYVPNNVLSVFFIFQHIAPMYHHTMYEHVSVKVTDFTFDKSDSFVTCLVEEKPIHVKKSLLCRSSPFFDNLINKQKLQDESKHLIIRNVSYDTFQHIVRYLESNGRFVSNTDITPSKLIELLIADDMFKVKNLKEFCEQNLIPITVKANAVRHLGLAIKYNAKQLERYAKRLIKLHLDDIIQTKEFLQMINHNSQIFSDILKEEPFKEVVSQVGSEQKLYEDMH